MKRVIASLSLLAFCFSQGLILHGQTGLQYERGATQMERILPPAPEAAAVTRYADVPVSMSTGAAELSIPIYTLQGKELSIPVSLQYHSNGIKLDEVAGVAGLGWTLEAGGCITREVNFMPDEYTSLTFQHSMPSASILVDLQAMPYNSQSTSFLQSVMWNQVDAVMDRYSYNVCGLCGTFIMSPEGTVTQLSGPGVIIQYHATPGTFTITGPDGTKYQMTVKETGTRKDQRILNPSPQSGSQVEWEATTAWYLSEVVSPSGAEHATLTYTEDITWNRDTRCANRSLTSTRQGNQQTYSSGSDAPRTEAEYSTVVVSSIQLGNTRVRFNYTSESSRNLHYVNYTEEAAWNFPRSLSEVIVERITGTQLKRVAVTTTRHQKDGRILLTALREYKGTGTLTDRWDFTYIRKGLNRRVYRYSQDWYGYFNGESGDGAHLYMVDEMPDARTWLGPYEFDPASHNIHLAHGTPNAPDATYLSLATANHDGARTEWEYEGAASDHLMNGDTLTVGIRVKSILVKDGDRPVRLRRFTYGNPRTTARWNPDVWLYVSESANMFAYGMSLGYQWTLTLHDSPVMEGPSLGACRVYYGRVTEDVSDPDAQPGDGSARTVYEYENDDTYNAFTITIGGYPSYWRNRFNGGDLAFMQNYYSYAPQGYAQEGHREWGLLKRREQWKWTGTGYQLVTSDQTQYTHPAGSTVLTGYHVSQVMVRQAFGDVEDVDYYHYPIYDRTMPAAYPTRTIHVDYHDTGNDTTTTILTQLYQNDALTSPSRVQSMRVSGADRERRVHYRYPDSGAENAPYASDMVSSHRLSVPISRTFSDGGTIVDSTIFAYFTVSIPGETPVSALLPMKRVELTDGEVSCSEEVQARDFRGNIIQIKERGKPVTTILWSYKGEYPVAIVENATYTTVENEYPATGGISSLTNASAPSAMHTAAINELRSLLSTAHVTTLSYTPGVGPSSMTDPSGQKVTYEYDSALRLAYIRDYSGNAVSGYDYALLNDGTNRLHVRTRQYRNASGTQYADDYTWWNTLGMKIQDISIGGSGDGRDLVTAYDGDFMLHDDIRAWLPYPASSTQGAFQAVADTASINYHDNAKAFVSKTYEISSRDWVDRTALPGYDGVHETLFREGSYNQLTRLVWDDSQGGITSHGSWPGPEVSTLTTTDADGRRSIRISDRFGHLLATAWYKNDTLQSPTRYVYDERGRLRAVAGSGISLTDTLNMWRYSYDTRGRLVSKGIPGSIREHYTYDDEDRIVRTQKGTERFTMKYDAFGRLTRRYYAPSAAVDSVLVEEHVYDARTSDILTFLSSAGQPWTYSTSGPCKGLEVESRLAEIDSEGDVAGYARTATVYDEYCRPIYTLTQYPDTIRVVQSLSYDFSGNPVQEVRTASKGNNTVSLTTNTAYDVRGRVIGIGTTLRENGTQAGRDTTLYQYDALGRLSSTGSSSGVLTSVGTENTYTLQGWLKKRTLKRSGNELFVETLYYDSDTLTGFSRSFTGKIAKKRELWKASSSIIPLKKIPISNDMFIEEGYAYDHAGRLERTGAIFWVGAIVPIHLHPSGVQLTFDGRGNVLTSRNYINGTYENTQTEYSYSGDRLLSENSFYFQHDSYGRMTYNGNTSRSTEYNMMDLPAKISDASAQNLVNFSYLTDGMKTSALNGGGRGLVYRGGMVFRRDSTGVLNFESVPFASGRMSSTGVRYELTDHLGSVRVVTDGSGDVLEASDYSAFGSQTDVTYDIRDALGLFPGSPSGVQSDPYYRHHFSGKEDQKEFNVPYTDFGARQYSTSIRRWMVPDPMSEKYYDVSPYVYCAGDPVNYVDEKGWEADLYQTILYSISHPKKAISVGPSRRGWNNISSIATRFSTTNDILINSQPTDSDDRIDEGTQVGAFRHTLWQAMIISRYGYYHAKRIGDVHEEDPSVNLSQRTFMSLSEADQTTDLLNNILGRNLGGSNMNATNNEMARIVLDYFHEYGLFTTHKNDKNEWVIERTKITDEQYELFTKALEELDEYGR